MHLLPECPSRNTTSKQNFDEADLFCSEIRSDTACLS